MLEPVSPDSEMEEIPLTPEQRKELEELEKSAQQNLVDELKNGNNRKEKQVLFECPIPICNGKAYTAVTIPYGPNGKRIVIGYECCECSVMFANPAKFSNRQ